MHLEHSKRYITLAVLQLVCLGDLYWEEEVTLIFLDMALQHLRPGVAHPAECPCRECVMGILILVEDLGGSGQSLSLARTMNLERFFAFLRLRQGFGTCGSSSGVGLSMCLSLGPFKSEACTVFRKGRVVCFCCPRPFVYRRS